MCVCVCGEREREREREHFKTENHLVLLFTQMSTLNWQESHGGGIKRGEEKKRFGAKKSKD